MGKQRLLRHGDSRDDERLRKLVGALKDALEHPLPTFYIHALRRAGFARAAAILIATPPVMCPFCFNIMGPEVMAALFPGFSGKAFHTLRKDFTSLSDEERQELLEVALGKYGSFLRDEDSYTKTSAAAGLISIYDLTDGPQRKRIGEKALAAMAEALETVYEDFPYPYRMLKKAGPMGKVLAVLWDAHAYARLFAKARARMALFSTFPLLPEDAQELVVRAALGVFGSFRESKYPFVGKNAEEMLHLLMERYDHVRELKEAIDREMA